MTEEIVNKICKEVFYTQPTEIIRNNVGLAGYVYTVQINNEKYAGYEKVIFVGHSMMFEALTGIEHMKPAEIIEWESLKN